MKKTLLGSKFFTLFVLLSLVMLPYASAEVGLSSSLEIDTTYETRDDGAGTDTENQGLGGWVQVGATSTKEAGNMFFQGTGDVRLHVDVDGDSDAEIQDVYAKMGTSMIDVQIGRFEGIGVYSFGEDVFVAAAPNAPGTYEVNYARGRMDSAGQIALHVNPNENIALELGTVYGNDTDEGVDMNVIGIRPVISASFGQFGIVAAYDYLTETPKDGDNNNEVEKSGYGVKLTAAFGDISAGINYTSGTQGGKGTDGVDLGDTDTDSYGGYVTWAMPTGSTLGVGAHFSEEGDNDTTKYFASYAHPLPMDDAVIKFGVSAAEGTVGGVDSDAIGFRVRFAYNF